MNSGIPHLATDDDIKTLLKSASTIALVGASTKPWRDSNGIMQYLQRAGYRIYPVNPNYEEVLGLQCYPSVREVPVPIDIVNIFRNPSHVMPLIHDAIAVNATSVWMQTGIISDEAARVAVGAGMMVVMDRCIMVDHRLRLGG